MLLSVIQWKTIFYRLCCLNLVGLNTLVYIQLYNVKTKKLERKHSQFGQKLGIP